jgi:hypothetical protein
MAALAVPSHHKSWLTARMEELDEFIDRPLGGIEVEIVYALAEVWFAVTLFWSVSASLNVTTLTDLPWYIPFQVISIPFWLSSSLTISGLILARAGNRICSPLRFSGAFVASMIWSWMFYKDLIVIKGNSGDTAFYFLGFIWQIRIMISAIRRGKIQFLHG